MVSLKDNHLIKRLEEEKNTTIMLMSHNAYWYQLQNLESRYKNFKLSFFGSGTAYARMRKNDIPKDCDFIILDGSEVYRDDEFCETKKMAMKMSEENNKRVSMGYVYFIPMEKRSDPDICSEIKIASFKNGDCDEETIPISMYNLLTLADIIIKTHNELENQITLQKSQPSQI